MHTVYDLLKCGFKLRIHGSRAAGLNSNQTETFDQNMHIKEEEWEGGNVRLEAMELTFDSVVVVTRYAMVSPREWNRSGSGVVPAQHLWFVRYSLSFSALSPPRHSVHIVGPCVKSRNR